MHESSIRNVGKLFLTIRKECCAPCSFLEHKIHLTCGCRKWTIEEICAIASPIGTNKPTQSALFYKPMGVKAFHTAGKALFPLEKMEAFLTR